MQINPVVIYIVLGLLAVTFIATIGAIASRKMKFNYAYLSPVSLAVYFLLGYFVSQKAGLSAVILASASVGFFDSTVGWQLCLFFNANLGVYREKSLNAPATVRVIFVILLSIAFGYIGHLIAGA